MLSYIEEYPYMLDVPESYDFEVCYVNGDSEKKINLYQYNRYNNINVFDIKDIDMKKLYNNIVLYNSIYDYDNSLDFEYFYLNCKNKFINDRKNILELIGKDKIHKNSFIEERKGENTKFIYKDNYCEIIINSINTATRSSFGTTYGVYINYIFIILYESVWNKTYSLFSLLSYHILLSDINNEMIINRYDFPKQINEYLNYKMLYIIETYSMITIKQMLLDKLKEIDINSSTTTFTT